MKLRMEIPVQKKEHRSKVKLIKSLKTTVWAITVEPEVVVVFASRDVK